MPRWRADGKRLFYLSLNGDMMAVDVQAGAGFQNGAPQRLFSNMPPAPWSLHPSGNASWRRDRAWTPGRFRRLRWC